MLSGITQGDGNWFRKLPRISQSRGFRHLKTGLEFQGCRSLYQAIFGEAAIHWQSQDFTCRRTMVVNANIIFFSAGDYSRLKEVSSGKTQR